MLLSILILGDDPNQINVSVLSIRFHHRENEYEIFEKSQANQCLLSILLFYNNEEEN